MKIERFGIEDKRENKCRNFKKVLTFIIVIFIIYKFPPEVVNQIQQLVKDLNAESDLIATWISSLATILGGIISGLFTYFGVLITLKQYKSSERKQSRLECIPFLRIELNELYNKELDLNIPKQESIYEIKNMNSNNSIKPKKTLYLKLKISNIGNGFANTLVVKTGENFGGIAYKKLILQNDSSELYLKINIYDETINNYEIEFAIEYIDCKTNEYIQSYSIMFENQDFKNADINIGYPEFLSQIHKI